MSRSLQTYRKVFEAIRSGRIAPVYVLHGPEEHVRREIIRALIEAVLPPENRAFNLDVFYGDAFDAERFDDGVTGFPMFTDRRLVIVKAFDAAPVSARDRIVAAVERPRDGCVLVVESDRERPDSARHRRLFEAARARGVAVPCTALDAREALDRVRARLARDGLTVEPEALELLLECVGPELLDLANEAEKLALVAATDGVVRTDHVRAVVGRHRTENLFAVLDRLDDPAPRRIVTAVARLLDAGEEPVFVLAMLQRRAAQRLQSALERGSPAAERYAALLEHLHAADVALKTRAVDARAIVEAALVGGWVHPSGCSGVGRTLT